MKRLIVLILLVTSFQINAQTNSDLIMHYEAYYKQMKKQSDVNGVIGALTHLNILSPSQERLDTLGYIYMSEGQYAQALNTIGFDKIANDSDIAIKVKAVSLKSLGQPKLAIGFFEDMFNRNPNALIAYELAELNLQTQNLTEAEKHITYGLANSKEDMTKTYYEMQSPYEVPLKSAFMYLNAPYLWGGKTPFGIDCSGFTQLIYKINGYKIDRDAKDQAKLGQVLSFVQESEPGDLAFFDNNELKSNSSSFNTLFSLLNNCRLT